MNVAVRADASTDLGTGHVMRCLTLADELQRHGATVRFVCARLTEGLVDLIARRGHAVRRLEPSSATGGAVPGGPRRTAGEGWQEDARATSAALAGGDPWDWLIVDHYGLDARWESRLRGHATHLMVIDDLADRPHDCDVLVDQDAAGWQTGYRGLVPEGCRLLVGTEYALVAPGFLALRPAALARRSGELRRILVFMGGNDSSNETTKALLGLERLAAAGLLVDVVIGAGNPHRHQVEEVCGRLPGGLLHVQTSRMADLMTMADCAIGAGGMATWERCVLGLPALTIVLADNQRRLANVVAEAGAQLVLGGREDLTPADYENAVTALNAGQLRSMSRCAADMCDGQGVHRVSRVLTEWGAGEPFHA